MANVVEVVIKGTDEASGPIRGVNNALGDLEGKSKTTGGAFSALGSVAGVAMAGIGIAAVGVVAGLGSAVGAASSFEAGIANVGALVNASAAEMEQLSVAALQLGQDTTLSGIGATDAAAAMAALAASGFTVEQMTHGVTLGVLQLASATGTSVTEAATIAGDAFGIFRQSMGLVAADMPQLANLFVGAANVSSIGLADIGSAMKYIGPVAASMGIDITNVTAAIAELGNQGIKGSEAGTALRSILVSIASPSKEAAAEIKDLGLQFFDSSGKVKDFGGISEELQTKLAGLTDQQRANALATIFGKEALSAATVMYGEGAEGIKKYITQMAEQGDAAAIGARRNDNLAGSWQSLKGVMETAQITIGQALTPALKGLTDWAAKALTAALPLISAWGTQLVAGIQLAIAVISRFGSYVASAIGAIVDAFTKLRSGEITLAQFIGGVKTMIATVIGDWGGLLANVAGFVAPYLAMIGSAIRSALPIIANELANLGRAFGSWIQTTAIPFLQANLPLWLSTLGGWLTGTAIPAVVGFVAQIGTAFGAWITSTAIPFLQTTLPLWLSTLGSWLTGTAIPAVVAFIKPLAEQFGAWVAETAIPFLITNIPAWLGNLVGWWYGTVIPAAISFLAELGRKFGTWVAETATPYLLTHLPGWMLALGDWINFTVLPSAIASLKQLGERFGTWVTETAVPYLQTNLPLWFTTLTSYLTGTVLPAIGRLATDIGTALYRKFMDELAKLLPAVKLEISNLVAYVGTVPAMIVSAIGYLGDLLADKGRELVQGLIDGIESMIGSLRQAISGLMGMINSVPGLPNIPGLPGRATGGPVGAGQAYLVGERGPEVFVPAQSGTIIPNHALGGGGGATYYVTITVGGSVISEGQLIDRVRQGLLERQRGLTTLGFR